MSATWVLTTLPAVASGWRHLGEVIDSEVPQQLDMTWVDFIRHSRLSKRTIYDLRRGIRTSYDDLTLTRLESALFWYPESVDRVLKGQEPNRIPDKHLARLQHIWPTLSEDVRALLVDLAERNSEH